MAVSSRPPANAFVAFWRHVYNPIGFSKGYNFILWFIFSGALLGFTLARFMYLDYYGVFCNSNKKGGNAAAPGECYYYLQGHYKIGMLIHLACILPAALLVLFQFVPVIRHKAILVHRLNGYAVIILSVLGTVGALMIARHAFGGDLATQTAVGALSIAFLLALALAYYNIKRLQIEQHRAWMLRAWFYASCIITIRIIQISSAHIMSSIGGYYSTRPCAQIDFIYKHSQKTVLTLYPGCEPFYNGTNVDQYVLTRANQNGNPVEIGTALGVGFGTAMWLAFAIHALGVEIYLQLTPAEFERLRNVSYERQLAAGFKHPGSAGLVVQRLGDAQPWVPEKLRDDHVMGAADVKLNGTGGQYEAVPLNDGVGNGDRGHLLADGERLEQRV